MTELRRFATVFAIAAMAIDLAFTAVYWLHGLRPHRFRRYAAIVGLMSAESAGIHYLLRRMR